MNEVQSFLFEDHGLRGALVRLGFPEAAPPGSTD